MAMACSRCRLAEAWLLLLVFLLVAMARTHGEKTMAVQNKVDNSSSSPSSAPSPAAGASTKQSSQGKEKKGCVSTKDCHMKRLVCAKKCTLDARKKCGAKCSRACSGYPICSSLPFP